MCRSFVCVCDCKSKAHFENGFEVNQFENRISGNGCCCGMHSVCVFMFSNTNTNVFAFHRTQKHFYIAFVSIQYIHFFFGFEQQNIRMFNRKNLLSNLSQRKLIHRSTDFKLFIFGWTASHSNCRFVGAQFIDLSIQFFSGIQRDRYNTNQHHVHSRQWRIFCFVHKNLRTH